MGKIWSVRGNYNSNYHGCLGKERTIVSGDEILIRLDTKQKKMEFVYNSDETILFNDFETGPDIKYRLIVNIASKDDCVEMQNFINFCHKQK